MSGSRTVVSCLYTLQFCIVLLHATAAPLQYRPLSGSHRTDGARAVSVLTETITELALDAPQTSYAKTSRLNTHIRNEKASYSNQTQAGPNKPLCSSKVAAMIPLTDFFIYLFYFSGRAIHYTSATKETTSVQI